VWSLNKCGRNLRPGTVDLRKAGVVGHCEVVRMNPVAHTIQWLNGMEKGQGCEGNLGREILAVSRGLRCPEDSVGETGLLYGRLSVETR
jgi:hypothetical protein